MFHRLNYMSEKSSRLNRMPHRLNYILSGCVGRLETPCLILSEKMYHTLIACINKWDNNDDSTYTGLRTQLPRVALA